MVCGSPLAVWDPLRSRPERGFEFLWLKSAAAARLTAAACKWQRCSWPKNYGGFHGTIGTTLALRLNAPRARPKTDQRRGYKWQTHL